MPSKRAIPTRSADRDADTPPDATETGTPGPGLRRSIDTLIDELIDEGGDRFAPARFRFIQGLADRARRQRPAVAALIEDKAMRLLSEYVHDYRAATPPGEADAEPLVAAQDNRYATPLRALTAALQQRADREESSGDRPLEDQLRRQEQQLMQSLGVAGSSLANTAGAVPNRDALNRSGAADRLRQSLQHHHRQQRVIRALEDGPDDPGPLNAQALVIQSLGIMRGLSQHYTDRFAAFMDAMFWLEDATRVAERKPARRGGRRKS